MSALGDASAARRAPKVTSPKGATFAEVAALGEEENRRDLAIFRSVWSTTAEDVLAAIESKLRICPAAIRSKHRDHRTSQITQARQLACWLLRSETEMSFPEIGKAVGGKHHTTVLHGVNAVDARRKRSKMWRKLTIEMRKVLRSNGKVGLAQ